MEMAEAIVSRGEHDVIGLTVLYDERCPLCRRLRRWLASRPALCRVGFVAADSADARERFPHLDHARTTRVLTVVDSDGRVYEGERAWLVCAWSIPGWRPVTEQLGTGLRLRAVRLATSVIDTYRHARIVDAEPCERCGLASPRRAQP